MTAWNSTLRRSAIGEKKRKRKDYPIPAGRDDWRLTEKGRNWPLNWMPEEGPEGWRATVEDYAFNHGWKTWHCQMPMKSKAGWFDLALMGQGRGLFAELKVRDKDGRLNMPTPKQWEYIVAAIRAGWDVRVWVWPDDYEAVWQELAG